MIVGWWLFGIVEGLRKRFLKAFSRVYRKRGAKSIRNLRSRAQFVSSAAHAAVPGGDYSGKPAPGTALGALLKGLFDFKQALSCLEG
jgi:hypothetical protein